MSEEESYIVRARDLAEIVRRENSAALEEFLKEPLAVIAGAITEGLANGPKALMGPAVRIAQSVLRGRMLQQFAQEVKELRKKGEIAQDFAEQKYGYQTWVELLGVIDSESPDEDRLEALKAMFYAANKVSATDGERILAYQLFQIAKTLKSNELLVLKAMNSLRSKGRFAEIKESEKLFQAIEGELGHSVRSLIVLAYNTLTEKRLVASLVLTELGIKFCENIKQYVIDKT